MKADQEQLQFAFDESPADCVDPARRVAVAEAEEEGQPSTSIWPAVNVDPNDPNVWECQVCGCECYGDEACPGCHEAEYEAEMGLQPTDPIVLPPR